MDSKRNLETMEKGYVSEKLSFNRKMVAASAAVSSRKSTIHSIAKVDITEPRRMIREHFERTGEKLSFTAYIVHCLSQSVMQFPRMNSFRRRNRLIILDDITISVLVEREFMGENYPEPMVIKGSQSLSYRTINDRIREAKKGNGRIGDLTGHAWIRLIPGFLLKLFVRIADRNISLARKYGKIAVTAVGMFSREPVWFIPHGSGTVLITVGSIEKRMVCNGDRHLEREFLCLTGSFDHDIVDGAPAARFMNLFLETVKSGIGLNRDWR